MSYNQAFLRGGPQPIAEGDSGNGPSPFLPTWNSANKQFCPRAPHRTGRGFVSLRHRLRPLPGRSRFLPFPFTGLFPLCTHNSNSTSGPRESTWNPSQQSDSEAVAHSDTLSSISLTLEITLLQLRQWPPIGSCGFTPSGGELLKVSGLEVIPNS